MIKTTVVGSYPVPSWLKLDPSPETIRDAARVVLLVQQQAGVDVVTDGELTRWNVREHRPSGMVERFASRMEGVATEVSAAQRLAYEERQDVAYRGTPAGVVVGDLGPGTLDLELDWRLAATLTLQPLKFTITSPYMIAKLLHDEWYHDFSQLLRNVADILAEQVARVGAAVVQIDEPNLPGSPQDAVLAADAINCILARVTGEPAVHLCFGNFGGQRVQHGYYGHLLEFFNRLECDHLVLETTRRPIDELKLLQNVKPSIKFGFGVIDVKNLQVEQPAQVAAKIEQLAEIVGPERVKYVHPDCGLSHLPRDVADRKLSSLNAGRDLFMNRK